jgi:hypothetical protein
VGAPSRPERLDILTKQLRSMSHSLTPSQVTMPCSRLQIEQSSACVREWWWQGRPCTRTACRITTPQCTQPLYLFRLSTSTTST